MQEKSWQQKSPFCLSYILLLYYYITPKEICQITVCQKILSLGFKLTLWRNTDIKYNQHFKAANKQNRCAWLSSINEKATQKRKALFPTWGRWNSDINILLVGVRIFILLSGKKSEQGCWKLQRKKNTGKTGIFDFTNSFRKIEIILTFWLQP